MADAFQQLKKQGDKLESEKKLWDEAEAKWYRAQVGRGDPSGALGAGFGR